MKVVRARAGVALLVAGGCSGSSEPAASVSAVIPAKAFNEAPVSVVIRGGPFRPAYTIDTGSGHTSIELSAFTAYLLPALGIPAVRVPVDGLTWRSTGELAADFPAGLGTGVYDVEVRDPRGSSSRLAMAFTSLGRDRAPPTITFTQVGPGALEAADQSVPVMVRADDGYGHLQALRWTVLQHNVSLDSGDCPIDLGASQTTCAFGFTAPAPDGLLDSVIIRADAQDSVGNDATADAQLTIAQRPQFSSLVPQSGPAGGSTDVTVTGANFVDGTLLLFDGVPADGIVLNGSSSMRGRTPPHDAASGVPVTLRTGTYEILVGTFDFVAPPRIRMIAPTSGPIEGGTPVVVAGNDFRVGYTRVYFGADMSAELGCTRVISSTRIEGVAPPGTGLVTVFAFDPVAGPGDATVTFSYAGDADGGLPVPGACAPSDGGAE